MDDIREILSYIPPSICTYNEWVQVGMALKNEGYPVDLWEQWSSTDTGRFNPGECQKKWNSFRAVEEPVTAGTLVQMAKNHGYSPQYGDDEVLDFDSVISAEGEPKAFIDRSWVEKKEVVIPDDWDPAQQLITYLETLFESDDYVGYVTQSWENKKGKRVPQKGNYDRTAGQLITELSRCGNDVGKVFGDYDKKTGAWIRFNPLDGKGVMNENVTDFRFALVESDDLDLDEQNALIRELELPVAALVYSGGKSLHAIVRVEAADAKEYRKRVEYLYGICQKNGLKIDTQNNNPSRLSRMPGVMRGKNKQYLIDTNIGKSSWNEWREWVDSVNDDLPDFENLSDYEDNLPTLADPLIDGILRKGHKMLLAGPSKAGKSFALIELCICIAEGVRWLGRQCAQGKVLYVNLELDKASCIHRFYDVYKALALPRTHINNIEIWNLRGMSVPMDKLAPMLIRRAEKEQFVAVVIDPIYKVITGDENSADQMANFCNQFDKICFRLGCAVIYCHHHSKGAQGDKRSMDRASGSGVFARDPDALLDLIELQITDSLRSQTEGREICQVCIDALEKAGIDMTEKIGQDDQLSSTAMEKHCKDMLPLVQYTDLVVAIEEAKKRVASFTAWRIEGTLREFPKFPPIDLWFKYPAHSPDVTGALADLAADTLNSKNSPYKSNLSKRKTNAERKEERRQSLECAFDVYSEGGGEVDISAICEYTGLSDDTIRRWVNDDFPEDYYIAKGKIGRRPQTAKSNK